MLEVEAKFQLLDPAGIEERLRSWGATLIADQVEVDYYLNAPDRDFARTDEALRLRRIGESNYLTYKGPRRECGSKTRPELEVPCPAGAEAAERFLQLFARLGYRQTAVVRKRRRILQWRRDGFQVHACLDSVEGLGNYIELEIVAEEADQPAARETIFRIAAELSLGPTEVRSYLEQILGENASAVTAPAR